MNLWHHDNALSKKCGTEHKEKVSFPFALLCTNNGGIQKNGGIAPHILNFETCWRCKVSFMSKGKIPSNPVAKRLEWKTEFSRKYSLLMCIFCSLNNNLMPIKIDWDSCILRHRFVTKINNVEQHASFFYLE